MRVRWNRPICDHILEPQSFASPLPMDASALPQWHAAQLPAELVAIAARLPHQRRPIILALLGEITHGRIAQHKHRASPRHRNLSSAWVATALGSTA